MSTAASTPQKVYIDIEYCRSWGYRTKVDRFSRLLQEHAAKDGSVQFIITSTVGRRSSFEMTVKKDPKDEGVLIYSKLNKGVFPDDGSLFAGLKEWATNGKVIEISEMV